MSTTAPLFPDLPVPAPRRAVFLPRYCPRNPAMRTALSFAMKLVESADDAQKREYYEKMRLALLAKDGLT
jgi:hypothetical protein